MVQILRDQRGLGNKDVGMGNQLSINQLIAHHSVVFKPDSLLVWVSAGPWQEGKFICYDLKKVFNLDISQIKDNQEIYLASRTIPADTFMNSENYRLFREYQTMSEQLALLKKTKQPLPENFDHDIPENQSIALSYLCSPGEYYEAIGIFDKALSCYNTALSCALPGLDEEQKLKEKADELNKKIRSWHIPKLNSKAKQKLSFSRMKNCINYWNTSRKNPGFMASYFRNHNIDISRNKNRARSSPDTSYHQGRPAIAR